jgi:hypothetical protein
LPFPGIPPRISLEDFAVSATQTSVQFYRNDRKLTACALGDPSLTLVQNDSDFGVPLAESAHEDSFSGRLYLDAVSYLCVHAEQRYYADCQSVAIHRDEGVWGSRGPQ